MNKLMPKRCEPVIINGHVMNYVLSLGTMGAKFYFNDIENLTIAAIADDHRSVIIPDPNDFFKMYAGNILMEYDEIVSVFSSGKLWPSFNKVMLYINCRSLGLKIYVSTALCLYDYFDYIVSKMSGYGGLINQHALRVARPLLCKFLHDTQVSDNEDPIEILTTIFGNSLVGSQFEMAFDLNEWAYTHCKEIAIDLSESIANCDKVTYSKNLISKKCLAYNPYVDAPVVRLNDKEMESLTQMLTVNNFRSGNIDTDRILIYLSWIDDHDMNGTSIKDFANLRSAEKCFLVIRAIKDTRFHLSFILDKCNEPHDFVAFTEDGFQDRAESIFWDVYEWAAKYRPKAIKNLNRSKDPII